MKVELGNIVKYHDDKGNTYTGTVGEIHPDGKHYLFYRFNFGAAHGWFKEENVFFKVKDKCVDHKWGVEHSTFKNEFTGVECVYGIACKICAGRYKESDNPFLNMLNETGPEPVEKTTPDET